MRVRRFDFGERIDADFVRLAAESAASDDVAAVRDRGAPGAAVATGEIVDLEGVAGVRDSTAV